MSFYVISFYMYEIVIYSDCFDDCRLGFNLDMLLVLDVFFMQVYINVFFVCFIVIDGIFDIFFLFDVYMIWCFLVFNFVCVVYVVVVFIKFYFVVFFIKSEFGKVINKDYMKVEQYFDKFFEKFCVIVVEDRS